MKYLSEEEEKKRLDLYNQGMSDAEIAKRVYVEKNVIQHWRTRRGLPPNAPKGFQKGNKYGCMGRLSEVKENKRCMLLCRGLNDTQIARIVGVENSTISQWRRSRGLPSNRKWTRRKVKENDLQNKAKK